MKQVKKVRNRVLGAVALVLVCMVAHGQEADVPFYAERVTRPNVMLLIDNSGSMSADGEVANDPRTRLQVVKDVLTGRPIYKNGSPVYDPRDQTTEGLFSVLVDDLDVLSTTGAPMVRVFRVTNDNGNYTAMYGGEYFVFLNQTSTPVDYRDSGMAEVADAIDTLDSYLREYQLDCIRKIATADITNDRPNGVNRDIFTAVDCAGVSSGDTLTFIDAMANYYAYEEYGIPPGGGPLFVVPVYYVPRSYTVTWTWPPTGTTVRGLCRAAYKNRTCTSNNCFYDCYKPGPISSSIYLVSYADLGVTTAQEVEAYKTTLNDWASYHGYQAVCPHSVTEVWGDAPYSSWSRTGCGGSPNQCPYRDGANVSRQIYRGCNIGDEGWIPVTFPYFDPDWIKEKILLTLPNVQAVDGLGDGTAGPEFQKGAGTTRIDNYIRQQLGITAPTLDMTRPDFGGYFTLYYDYLVNPSDLGIMDIYTDVNYGLMVYDNNSGSCSGDDFPRDASAFNSTSNRCLGATLIRNLTTWADFPAYLNTTTRQENLKLQKTIASPNYIVANGSTPIAASLHDAYRYFYNVNDYTGTDTRSLNWNDTMPSMFYDLAWPHPSGTNNRHIVQDDPYYENGCRRNFLIFLTDGQQTDGEPFSQYYSPSYIQSASESFRQNIYNTQVHWVEALREGGGGGSSAGGGPATGVNPCRSASSTRA
jgi:hypothetical protein